MKTQKTSNSQHRIEHIDGLRGVAITLVVLYHLWIFSGWTGNGPWNPLSYAYTGLHLFLVISGFCVCWPYANGQPFALREFAMRRAYRIMPPYLVGLFCFVVIALVFSRLNWEWPENPHANLGFTLRPAISHVLLIHNLLPNHILAINGPFWSIALEAQLYVTVPLLVVLIRRYGVLRTLLISASVTLAFRYGVVAWYGSVASLENLGTTSYALMHSLPARWFEFALGAGVAHVIAQRKVLPPAGVLVGAGLVALVLGACAVCFLGGQHPLTDPLFGTGYGLLLLSGTASGTSALSRWWLEGMKWRPLILLGQISFSVYLVHQPFIRLFCGWLHRFTAAPLAWFACGCCLALPAALLLSITFYWLVERTAILWARNRLARYKLQRPPPAVPNAVMQVAETKVA